MPDKFLAGCIGLEYLVMHKWCAQLFLCLPGESLFCSKVVMKLLPKLLYHGGIKIQKSNMSFYPFSLLRTVLTLI